uniref:Uncharacterized protein n=1 Tax=Arundo donax TaxID=35708 RepID=A0A0A9HM26_ARUDO
MAAPPRPPPCPIWPPGLRHHRVDEEESDGRIRPTSAPRRIPPPAASRTLLTATASHTPPLLPLEVAVVQGSCRAPLDPATPHRGGRLQAAHRPPLLPPCASGGPTHRAPPLATRSGAPELVKHHLTAGAAPLACPAAQRRRRGLLERRGSACSAHLLLFMTSRHPLEAPW